MRTRWLVAVGVALLGVGVARAQPAALPAIPPAPGQLPPLLPVPLPSAVPLAEVPRPGAPGFEYDHGYQYLPERSPERFRHPAEDACGPDGRWWISPSLDLAWASTRPAPSTVRLPLASRGALPGLLLPVGGRDAGRFESALGLVVGRWFGETNTHGVEASFFVRDANATFAGRAPGTLVLFPGGADRSAPQVVVLPDAIGSQVVGRFPATLGTFFATVDVNYRHKLFCAENARLDALAGYRYAYLGDELYLGELPIDYGRGRDAFRLNRAAVSSAFHGGQIGLAGEVRAGGWYAAGSVKVAFGAVTPEATATGLFAAAEGRTATGFRRLGALTGADRSELAVMPVLNVQVGRQVSAHARVFAGYSFNYLSRVGRLGDTLDAANAALTLTDFWVQSISLGAEFRF